MRVVAGVAPERQDKRNGASGLEMPWCSHRQDPGGGGGMEAWFVAYVTLTRLLDGLTPDSKGETDL